MKQLMRAFLVGALCLLSGQAMAQGLTLSGVVTDQSTGEPLPAVNIFVPTLNRGAVTDVDGNYSLVLPAGTHELVISSVGYKRTRQNVTLSRNMTLNIEMEPDVVGLDQVVVVGFGEVSRRDVTGSISSVTTDDIAYQPVNTVENAIQGKIAGVFIQQDNGKLGQGMTVRIRGSSSVTAGNQPLYVIDGVPAISDDFSTNGAVTNPLADLNFNDVESIQILKDASAAAIYGSRAANGVVLITTKKGRAGRTQFTYNFQTGFSEPTNKMEFMNATEYRDYFRQAAINSENYYGDGCSVVPNDPNCYDYIGDVEFYFGYMAQGTDFENAEVNSNWQDEAFQDAGMFSHDLSAMGGNEQTRFYASGHFSDQDGILIRNRYQRISGRLNVDHKASERIDLGVSVNSSRTLNQRLAADNAFSTPLQLVAQSPLSPIYIPGTDELNPNTIYYNGLFDRDFASYKTKTFRTLANAYGTFRFSPSLMLRGDLGADIMTVNDEEFYGPETADNWSNNVGGIGFNTWQQSVTYTASTYLNWQGSLARDHRVDATVGTSMQYSDYNYADVFGRNFTAAGLRNLISAAEILGGGSNGSEYAFTSYFARANYNYKEKYLATISGRVDASSRFGADNRYGFFPAASFGWVITEEDFSASIREQLSYAKMRVSYGLTGNAEIGNFPYLALWGGNSYASLPGQSPTQTANPDLKWEQTSQFNVGMDYGLFNNRVTGEFDWYVKKTEDLLLNVNVPATTGFLSAVKNVGSLENKGWELVINTFNLTGDFKWNSSFNISSNKNKITNIDGQVITGGFINRAIEGQPIGVFYGKEYAGVDETNGDALYYVYAADGTRTTTASWSAATDRVIGDPNPDYVGGFTNAFSYKGFDLSVLFQFVQGNDRYFGGMGRFAVANGDFFDNQTRDQLNSWTPTNTNTNVPEARLYGGNGTRHSSRYIMDGSYVRLKNVTLSYNVPRTLLQGTGMSKVRLYTTGINLLTWTDYKGWDPEVDTDFIGGNIGLGNDFYSAPQAKTITFGVEIGF